MSRIALDPTEPTAALPQASASLCLEAGRSASSARMERSRSRALVVKSTRRRRDRALGLVGALERAAVLGAVRRIKGRVAALAERADLELSDGPDPVISGYLARINSQLDRILAEERGRLRESPGG